MYMDDISVPIPCTNRTHSYVCMYMNDVCVQLPCTNNTHLEVLWGVNLDSMFCPFHA